jgi:hypothetical protein
LITLRWARKSRQKGQELKEKAGRKAGRGDPPGIFRWLRRARADGAGESPRNPYKALALVDRNEGSVGELAI